MSFLFVCLFVFCVRLFFFLFVCLFVSQMEFDTKCTSATRTLYKM